MLMVTVMIMMRTMLLPCRPQSQQQQPQSQFATVRMLLLPVLTSLLLLPAKQLGLHCIDAIPIASRAPRPEPDP